MRLSIWQQWSSNHSGIFRVVGAFKTEAEAQAASEAARGVLRRILRKLDAGEPEAERTVAAEHGFEWREPTDWLTSEREIEKAVQQVERLVFISNTYDTWNRSQPYQALLRRLGADAVGGWDIETVESAEPIHWLVMDLRCRLPDEESAQRLISWWRAEFEGRSGWGKVSQTGASVEFVDVPVDYRRTAQLFNQLVIHDAADMHYSLTRRDIRHEG